MDAAEGPDRPSRPDRRLRDPHEGVPGASSFRVAVTRPDTGDDRFREALEERGLVPVDHPLLSILPPEDTDPLRRLARALVEWEEGAAAPWLLVTSRQVLPPLAEALAAIGADARDVRARGVRVAAVGSATAAALTEWGLPPEVMPDRYTGDDLLDALVAAAGREDARRARSAVPGEPGGTGVPGSAGPLSGQCFLFPRAERAREVLPDGLRARGAHVDLVTAYRIVPDPSGARRLWDAVTREEVEVVTFTSGSALRTLAGAIPEGAVWPDGVRVAVIGPVTAESARGTPIPIHHVADEFTLEALAAVISPDSTFTTDV